MKHKHFILARRIDGAEHGLLVHNKADTHADIGILVHKVGSAICISTSCIIVSVNLSNLRSIDL